MTTKPRKVRAKIYREVVEIAIVYLDRNGYIEECDEILDELDMDNVELIEILDVHTVHD